MSTTKTTLVILSLVCILCNTTITATAQSLRGNGQPPIKNIVTLNPFILFSGIIVDAKYERTFNDLFSLVVNPSFYNPPTFENRGDYSSTTGIYSNMKDYNLQTLNIWFQGRFYLSNKSDAPRGWFIAPALSIGYLSVSSTNNTTSEKISANTASFNTGLIGGYQAILKGHFVIDAYFGITRYYMANPQASTLVKQVYDSNILPSWGLGFGYAF